jgi:cell division protein FtsQ
MKKKRFSIKKGLFKMLILGFILMISVASIVKQKSIVCKDVVIALNPAEGIHFLEANNVMEIATGNSIETTLHGKTLKGLRTDLMLRNLYQSPFVREADIFMGQNGLLNIRVEQRKPMFRIINQQGQSYYVEKSGMKIPFVKKHTVRVPVLSGNIAEMMEDSTHVKTTTLKEATLVFEKILADPFWTAQIEQVYVDNFQEFLLIPKVGNHTIVVGNTERLQEKFDMLKTFYFEGLSKTGWHVYREIDLRYKGQIVARKWHSEL